MPEMIKFLTKKFSTHSLTEVKPAEHFTLHGHNTRHEDRKDRNENRAENETKRLSLVSLSEDEGEDEEISTINLCQSNDVRTLQLPKHSPKLQESESTSRFETRPKPPPLRHITPPLKQFEMRLPDIETEKKNSAIKPRKCLRATNSQLMKSLERQSPLLRRPAFQDYSKETPRPSAFIRIPHIEGAKIHPRSEKYNLTHKEKRNSKELSPLADKIVISKPIPHDVALTRDMPTKTRDVMMTTHDVTMTSRETSHSDSEVSDSKSNNNLTTFLLGARRSDSFTGKKSPTPSLSLLDRESYQRMKSPTPSLSLLDRESYQRMTPPLKAAHCLFDRHTPSPLNRDKLSPSPSYRHSPSPQHRLSPPPHQRFEYKCITTLATEPLHDSEKLHALLERTAKFTPIGLEGERKRRLKEDDQEKRRVKEEEQDRKMKTDRIREFSRSPPNKFLISYSGHGAQRKSWEKTDVEMVESFDTDRNVMHHSRLNAAYNKDLKRKYSVVPVDDEVRSICAATSKSNFKAFILTANHSQSGLNHRTIDISVVRPNKRVCCTDGNSPPLIRRPSINVEKMAQTVLIRRPLVRKAGNSNRVWSTKEEQVRVPIPIRPMKQQNPSPFVSTGS